MRRGCWTRSGGARSGQAWVNERSILFGHLDGTVSAGLRADASGDAASSPKFVLVEEAPLGSF